jgi:hypothetical protein
MSHTDEKRVGEQAGPFRHPDHRRPVTRRQFLAQGFLTGAAAIAGPTLLGLFRSKEAYAQALDCSRPVVAGAGRIPFIGFDLAGGANMAGSNVLGGGPGGQTDFLSDQGYLKMGLPQAINPRRDPAQIDTQLGLAFHADSAFLRGIIDKTTATTRQNVNGVLLVARSDNDTGNNPHNPIYGINKAGADGDLVTLIGTRSSDSGGNSAVPMSMFDPTVRPTKVERPSDATGLVDTGKLIQLLDQSDAATVMCAVERLSAMKLDRMTEQAVVKDLIQGSYEATTDLVNTFGDPTLLDPTLDPDIVGPILSAGELGQSEFRKTASVMKLVVNGFAGAGTIEFGGYDYHTGDRSTGERKDFIAGQAMGAALEYAARRSQQLMLYVFSDGSVSSDGVIDNSGAGRGKGVWRGDNSSTAASFILVYDPAGPPPLASPTSQQIGWFRSDGSVDTGSSRVANNVPILAESVVLNYLALHDEVSRIDEVLPGHRLGSGAELDALVGLGPIRAAST